MCEACMKRLKDQFAAIQHCELRHLADQSVDHKLDPRDVLLHYLTGVKAVKCPFKVFFDESQMHNMKNEDDDDEDSSDDSSDSDESSSSESNEEKYAVTPLTYDKSEGIRCEICNEEFQNVESLRNHCWLVHNDIFVKIATGKSSGKEKNEEDEKKQLQFGKFCIDQLKIATVNDDMTVQCKLCKTAVNSMDKYFNHAFFKHQNFVFVKKQQYDKWPMRYSEFTDIMKKQEKMISNAVNMNALAEFHLFDKTQKKCVDCNVTLQNKKEQVEHYINHHLIYFPFESNQ